MSYATINSVNVPVLSRKYFELLNGGIEVSVQWASFVEKTIRKYLGDHYFKRPSIKRGTWVFSFAVKKENIPQALMTWLFEQVASFKAKYRSNYVTRKDPSSLVYQANRANKKYKAPKQRKASNRELQRKVDSGELGQTQRTANGKRPRAKASNAELQRKIASGELGSGRTPNGNGKGGRTITCEQRRKETARQRIEHQRAMQNYTPWDGLTVNATATAPNQPQRPMPKQSENVATGGTNRPSALVLPPAPRTVRERIEQQRRQPVLRKDKTVTYSNTFVLPSKPVSARPSTSCPTRRQAVTAPSPKRRRPVTKPVIRVRSLAEEKIVANAVAEFGF